MTRSCRPAAPAPTGSPSGDTCAIHLASPPAPDSAPTQAAATAGTRQQGPGLWHPLCPRWLPDVRATLAPHRGLWAGPAGTPSVSIQGTTGSGHPPSPRGASGTHRDGPSVTVGSHVCGQARGAQSHHRRAEGAFGWHGHMCGRHLPSKSLPDVTLWSTSPQGTQQGPGNPLGHGTARGTGRSRRHPGSRQPTPSSNTGPRVASPGGACASCS